MSTVTDVDQRGPPHLFFSEAQSHLTRGEELLSSQRFYVDVIDSKDWLISKRFVNPDIPVVFGGSTHLMHTKSRMDSLRFQSSLLLVCIKLLTFPPTRWSQLLHRGILVWSPIVCTALQQLDYNSFGTTYLPRLGIGKRTPEHCHVCREQII